MSALSNSGASAWLPTNRRWAQRVRFSTSSIRFTAQGDSAMPVQPASASAESAAAPRARNDRRKMGSDILRLRLDGKPAGDHRAHPVERRRQDQRKHVNNEETQKRERDDEMNRSRALSPPEHPQQERIAAVHVWRHGETGEHDERPQHEDGDEISQLLQRVVVLGGLTLRELQLVVGDDLVRDWRQ